MTAEIIAFPLQHRVVPTEETLVVMPLKLSQKDEQASVIDHDGRPYKLADLIRHLSPAKLRQVARRRRGRVRRFGTRSCVGGQHSPLRSSRGYLLQDECEAIARIRPTCISQDRCGRIRGCGSKSPITSMT